MSQGLLHSQLLLPELPLHFLDALSLEGRLSVQHLKQKDPQTPNVHLLVVGLVVDKLWSHVLAGPAEALPRLSPDDFLGPAEVADFDIEVLVEQNVLGLQVSVHDCALVQVLNALANLREESKSQFLAHSFSGVDVEVEIPLADVLQDNVDEVAVVEGLYERDDVFVSQILVNLYFLNDVDFVFGLERLDVDFLDCEHFLVRSSHRLHYLRVGSLAQDFLLVFYHVEIL